MGLRIKRPGWTARAAGPYDHVSCDREPAGRPRVAWRDGNKLRARGRRVTSLTLFVCMRAVASDQTSPLRVVTLFGARRPRRAERGQAGAGGAARALCGACE